MGILYQKLTRAATRCGSVTALDKKIGRPGDCRLACVCLVPTCVSELRPCLGGAAAARRLPPAGLGHPRRGADRGGSPGRQRTHPTRGHHVRVSRRLTDVHREQLGEARVGIGRRCGRQGAPRELDGSAPTAGARCRPADRGDELLGPEGRETGGGQRIVQRAQMLLGTDRGHLHAGQIFRLGRHVDNRVERQQRPTKQRLRLGTSLKPIDERDRLQHEPVDRAAVASHGEQRGTGAGQQLHPGRAGVQGDPVPLVGAEHEQEGSGEVELLDRLPLQESGQEPAPADHHLDRCRMQRRTRQLLEPLHVLLGPRCGTTAELSVSFGIHQETLTIFIGFAEIEFRLFFKVAQVNHFYLKKSSPLRDLIEVSTFGFTSFSSE